MSYSEFRELYTRLHIEVRGYEPFNLQVRRAYPRLNALTPIQIKEELTK